MMPADRPYAAIEMALGNGGIDQVGADGLESLDGARLIGHRLRVA